MINYVSNILPCSKRVFSDVPEGMVQETFSGGKPSDPLFTLAVTTGLSPSSNDMACHAPISKTLGAVLFMFYKEQVYLGVNQTNIVPHIYYHCNGVLLASAVILQMNFSQGKISFCLAETSYTSQ